MYGINSVKIANSGYILRNFLFGICTKVVQDLREFMCARRHKIFA